MKPTVLGVFIANEENSTVSVWFFVNILRNVLLLIKPADQSWDAPCGRFSHQQSPCVVTTPGKAVASTDLTADSKTGVLI